MGEGQGVKGGVGAVARGGCQTGEEAGEEGGGVVSSVHHHRERQVEVGLGIGLCPLIGHFMLVLNLNLSICL